MAFSIRLPKSGFAHKVLTLMTGTTIGQAIPILFSPILTRLYSPEEFGTFGLFLSILTFLGIIGTAKYELAILLPKEDGEAVNITRLSLYLVSIFSILSFSVFVPFNDTIANFLGDKNLEPYLLLVPIGIAIIGYFNTFNYWANRKSLFKKMAGGKILKSTANTSFNIGFGILKLGSIGLIIGTLVGQLIEAFYLGINFFKENAFFTPRSLKQIKRVLIKYRKFPQFSLGSTLLNTASLQLPIIILSRYFDSAAAGLFFHAHKVLSVPMSVVGSSMGQVFFQEISKRKDEQGFVSYFTYKTFKKLLLIGVGPLGIVLVFGDLIFAFVFGDEWGKSGYIAQLLSPWLLTVFIFSPISTITFAFERQEIALILNIIILIMRFSTLYFGSLFFNEIGHVISLFGIASFLIWICFGIYLLTLAKVNLQKCLGISLIACLPIVSFFYFLRMVLINA